MLHEKYLHSINVHLLILDFPQYYLLRFYCTVYKSIESSVFTHTLLSDPSLAPHSRCSYSKDLYTFSRETSQMSSLSF